MLLLILLPWYALYTCTILLSTYMSNWLSMWTMLELSSWTMMILSLNSSNHEILFKMYAMFSMSSVMLVLFWLWLPNQEEWILCLLAFKMGIPPLHWWMGWVMKHMKWMTMWWFTTFHKIIPMLITLLYINSVLIFWWSMLSLLWSSISFWFVSSYFAIFFYSSCVHTSWLWMTIYSSYSFLLYFFFYTLIMYYIFIKIKNTSPWTQDNELAIMMIIMLGVPTSMIFFMKFITISTYLNHMILLMWMLLLINITTILPYTRMVWNLMTNSLITTNNVYYTHTTSILSTLLLVLQFSLWPITL